MNIEPVKTNYDIVSKFIFHSTIKNNALYYFNENNMLEKPSNCPINLI